MSFARFAFNKLILIKLQSRLKHPDVPARASPFLNAGIGVVIVDALEIFRLDLVPRHPGVSIELERHVAHQILHEHRVFIGALRHELFVLPLEQCVQLRTRRTFDHRHHVLDPDRLREPQRHRHQPALVVRAVSGNRLRTRTQRRYVCLHRQHKINLPAARRCVEPRDVIHHASLARHRRFFGHEIRELDFQVRRGRVQPLLQRMQNVPDVLHVHDAAMRVERLDKPAHVRAFELLRQIHEHPDGRHRVLDAVRLVAHLDGKPQSAHAGFVNSQLTMVALALLVVKLLRRRVLFGPAQGNAFPADFQHGTKLSALRDLAKVFFVGTDTRHSSCSTARNPLDLSCFLHHIIPRRRLEVRGLTFSGWAWFLYHMPFIRLWNGRGNWFDKVQSPSVIHLSTPG